MEDANVRQEIAETMGMPLNDEYHQASNTLPVPRRSATRRRLIRS